MSEPTSSLKSLAASVGDFIAYWGFRGIHGQLWALVWLAREPQTGAQLCRALEVSKALVSPALAELEEYDLVRQVESTDGRAKRYVANPDVYGVIKNVLRNREMSLLSRAEGEVTYVLRRMATDAVLADAVVPERLLALQSMIAAGNGALALLTAIDGLESLVVGAGPDGPTKY